jgi:hypothetical protein
MLKVGRNEPCPCNSGKKFKKCHGLRPSEVPSIIQTLPFVQKTADIKLPTLPGMSLNLIMQAGYKDRRSLKNVSNLPGNYKVTFTLSRPGFAPVDDRHISASQHLSGDSHLAIASPALEYSDGTKYDYDSLLFEVKTVNGNFTFKGLANEKGMLGKIESEEFHAATFADAAARSLHALAPTLSSISASLDVPVNVYQTEVVELRTNTRLITARGPFKEVIGWIPPVDNASVEQQKYLSLYREALNSTSSNYSFLCFYRIVEGLRHHRETTRAAVVKAALQKGEKPQALLSERIPSEVADQTQWLNSLYSKPQGWDEEALKAVFIPEIVGKKLSHVIDKGQALHVLRNKISHAVLESDKPVISIDNSLDVAEVEKWLPVVKFIARYLLLDEFPDVAGSSTRASG